MKIYSVKSDLSVGNSRLEKLIGKDLWFRCFYRNDMYWYHLIDVTDTDYVGYSISDYRVDRIQRNKTNVAHSEIRDKVLSELEYYPIRNFKKRFSEALQGYRPQVLTTAELFNLEDEQ